MRHPDGTVEALAIGLPGDREVDAKRLESKLGEGVVFEPFGEADFAARPTLAKGYIGPGALGEKKPAGVRYLLDPRVVDGTRWVTGADVDGSHVLDLVAGRDFSGDGVIDVGEVRDGDPCPVCGATDGGVLESARGIEMGHIFQLGRKYADALDLQVLDENGKLVTVTMGSYGIGPSRAVAAIAEGTLDELGLSWPRDVAPADVHLVATGKDEEVFATAERIATELSAAGVEVLYDDRPGKVSPGVKFKDAEMIGVPTIVVVGRNLAEGTVEVRDRASGEREDVAVESVVDHVVAGRQGLRTGGWRTGISGGGRGLLTGGSPTGAGRLPVRGREDRSHGPPEHRPARGDDPLPGERAGGRAAGRVRARVPGRRHAVVRRARAAGGGGVPHLRADLAAGLAQDRHEARCRPVAARGGAAWWRASWRRWTCTTW